MVMKHSSHCRSLWLFVGVVLVFSLANPALGGITADPPWQSEATYAPDPAAMIWNSSIAYYDGQLIYAGGDKKVYALNVDDGSTTLVCDTSTLSDPGAAVSGFLVSNDNHLYFHANTFPTVVIYRILLTDTWPADYEVLDTGCHGSIFSLTQNPWTDIVWFASADLGSGVMYLYEVSAAFDNVKERASFNAPTFGGNGPIIFKGPSTLLYGESVWGGNGYFHLIDSTTGEVTTEDYLIFDGGLVGATYGYDNIIYVTTGGGKTIYEINGTTKTQVGTTDVDAQGIVFDGNSFYISTQIPWSGGLDDGKISLYEARNIDAIAGVILTGLYRAQALPTPNPSIYSWNSSIAYYDGQLIYAGGDKKVYALNVDDGSTTLVCDTSTLSDPGAAVSGFLVSNDNHLYFHANTFPTVVIYRILLTDTWPADYEVLDTGCHGSIFSLTQNPWTDIVWFASADLGSGVMYLYEVSAAFDNVKERASFNAPTFGGNGPIIFKGPSTLLYGESVWGGNGYFHLIDSTTGEVTTEDYLIFDGGLVGATYGYDNIIYVTTGGGKTIYEINGTTKTQVGTTDVDAQGIVFDGNSFYISTQIPWSGGLDDGKISLYELSQGVSAGVPVGQMVPPGTVDGDMAVSAQSISGSKAIGISAGDQNTFVEFLKAVDPSTITDNDNRPETLPFGLVNFRLKVTSPDGTATLKVFLSEEVPQGALWYKYDAIKGWHDYSSHAQLGADKKSFTLEFKDGGYGDADRIVNGYITDPGGVAGTSLTAPNTEGTGSTSNSPGGGASGCFITTAGLDGTNPGTYSALFLWAWLTCGCFLGGLLARRWVNGTKPLQWQQRLRPNPAALR